MLPAMPNKDRIRQTQTLTFGGINRQPNAPDGTIVFTTNIGSDKMPCIAPRPKRWLIGQYNNLHGLFAYNGVYTVRGLDIYKDDTKIGTAVNTKDKKFAQMTGRVIMFPDKLIINASETENVEPEEVVVPKYEYTKQVSFENDRIVWSLDTPWWTAPLIKAGDTITVSGASTSANNKSAVVVSTNEAETIVAPGTFVMDGVYQTVTVTEGTPPTPVQLAHPMEVLIEDVEVDFASITSDVSSTNNAMIGPTIDYSWEDQGLRVGDAVKIVGTDFEKEDIIRAIQGPALIFYDDAFTPDSDVTVTVSRSVPDLDGILAHENRLWGYKGNTIYASKLGDPLNFNVFDGLESDSWAADLDGSGEILGAIVYQGYPTFFKEDRVVRVYGDRPTQYRLMEVSNMGLHPNCGDSLAVAGDTLWYVSRNGVTYYSGGYAQNAHAPFGDYVFNKAKAASDGRRYFLSVQERQGDWAIYVYDTVYGCWFREDGNRVLFSAYDRGNLYMYHQQGGNLWLDGRATNPPSAPQESPLVSSVMFGDFTGANWSNGWNTGNPTRKGTSKILLRLTLGVGASVNIRIKYDTTDQWETIKTLTGPASGEAKMKSFYLPIIPRRSDNYRIELTECTGDWILHSLVREEYSGSPLH